LDEVKWGATKLGAANLTMAHADGFSGIGVATGLLLGLVAKARGLGGQASKTTMLATLSHVLAEDMVEYAGRPAAPTADAGLHGLSARYRLYEAAEGWVFLAAPSNREWERLVAALEVDIDPGAEDDVLADRLAEVFAKDSAAAWEARLTAAGVACVEVEAGPSHVVLMDDNRLGREFGMVVDVPHDVLDEHPRLGPLISFSRSATRALPAPVCGQHTDETLRDVLGLSDARLAALRESGVLL
jgi:crotonobetainyl-CoA:carnitine CoA-transferase CaiB-like acyl-CoA transferase